MALEIERKFLVINDSFRRMASSSVKITQGYLSRDPDRTIRVRLFGDDAFITIKSRNSGATRHEWEYPIPGDDAAELLTLCDGKRIDKQRFIVPFDGLKWEVDVFENSDLILAEVELPDADYHLNSLPPFIGTEVTGDPRYYNSNIKTDRQDDEIAKKQQLCNSL